MPASPATLNHLVDLTKYEPLTPSTDFTVYWPKSTTDDSVCPGFVGGCFGKSEGRRTAGESINEQVRLKLPGQNGAEQSEARCCICSCFQGSFASGTFRTQDEPRIKSPAVPDPIWKCSTWSKFDGETEQTKFLFETHELVCALWDCIGLNSAKPPSGLVVFSGSTKSGKSSVAKAFALESVRRILDDPTREDRLPHLVTYEDPIEPWKLSVQTEPCNPNRTTDNGVAFLNAPSAAHRHGFCLTPRQKNTDVASLTRALADAKRQTPACVYIGEIRDQHEWRQVIDFAGTGHLVVTTTHAARLNETVARIIQATKAVTPADRRKIGGYLTGCIHLQSTPVKIGERTKEVIFPTLWARRGAALNSLVADGLSSITPNGDYVLSKTQFLDELLSRTRERFRQCPEVRTPLESRALQLDAEDLSQQ